MPGTPAARPARPAVGSPHCPEMVNGPMMLVSQAQFETKLLRVEGVEYCLFALNKIIFFYFHFLCLIWHVITRNG